MKEVLYNLPVVPLRGIVIFPETSFSFDIGREKSIAALDSASENDSMLFLAAQKDMSVEDPSFADISPVGVIARVTQVMKLPGGICRAVVHGVCRGRLRESLAEKPYFRAVIEEAEDALPDDPAVYQALYRRLRQEYEGYFAAAPRISAEQFVKIMAMEDLSQLAYSVSASLPFEPGKKQRILEFDDIGERVEYILSGIEEEVRILKIDAAISEKVRRSMDDNQREYYLREQLKAIQEELGDRDGLSQEIADYRAKLKKLRLKKEVADKIEKEINRFSKTGQQAAEGGVLRNYLDTVLALPWNKRTRENTDIARARQILDRDHYGLEKVKERILEYLAVRHFTGGSGSPILCLVGPPGVGKTSIARSVAEALNRKYVRISLGGIHDEADIRGHRKTYIGAMEGRIMAAVSQAGTKNPLILLDEVDKMGVDYKGDPSAALLEVLDSEQNYAFRDHFLEVPFDLSEALFITTANTLDTVSRPLLDRMEIIELSGYTEEEKFHIAKRYLLPRSLEKTGISNKHVTVSNEALHDMINYYTREAGVRRLEQVTENLCRKLAKNMLQNDRASSRITRKNLTDFLGRHRFRYEPMNENDEIGIVRGLAWTAAGGDTLSIEVNIMDGTGRIELTGQLGDVMKESARAAISYARANCSALGIDGDFYKTKDIHIHIPEGAIPKDGPSAGVTIALAVISALTKKPVRKDIAMTGEITLRGRVLPIGGLKEKSMAAYRAGIRTVFIPEENAGDLDDIPPSIKKNMTFIPVRNMREITDAAFTSGH